MSDDFVIIDRPQEQHLLVTMVIRDFIFQIHIDLEHGLSADYQVKVSGDTGKVNLIFQKTEADVQWVSLGKYLDKHNTYVKYSSFSPAYRDCTVASVKPVTRDCNLYEICLPPGTRMRVPLGYHVHVRHKVEGVEVVRSYTAVLPSLLGNSGDTRLREGRIIYLMIKIYKDGALTPWIGSITPGDHIEVSSWEGTFQLSRARESTHLVMFAAGTGFTPMVQLINNGFSNDSQTESREVKLMFFNKTEEDIIWRDQLSALAEKSDRFTVTHVLSEPGEDWPGLRGRVNQQMMKDFLPDLGDNDRLLLCACGPTPFTNSVISYAKELGYNKDSLHAFLG